MAKIREMVFSLSKHSSESKCRDRRKSGVWNSEGNYNRRNCEKSE